MAEGKRKVKAGEIEVDYANPAIVVNYEMETTTVGPKGEPIVDRKASQKRINLSRLSESSNIPMLAQEIVEKCKLIHPSKIPLVEQLLESLRDRHVSEDRKPPTTARRTSRSESVDSPGRQREPRETAYLGKLDTYIEKLYEETDQQIKAAMLILDLAKRPENLEVLVSEETLFSVLARLLHDDARKDIDLTTIIISIFACFARYSQFHPFILQHKVGHTCTKLIAREMERRGVLDDDLEKAKQQLTSASNEGKAAMQDVYVKITKKNERIRNKQESLLAVCFGVLLHLAEDVSIEKKMKKHCIVQDLVALLNADNPELLAVALLFLKKLSIFKENKDDMAEGDIVGKLVRFVPCTNGGLMNTAMRLLVNLSFSAELQDAMVTCGLIPRLIGQLKDPGTRQSSLRILYHLSMDDKHRSLFTYTEAIPIIVKLIVEDPSDRVSREVVALAVNLALNARNAELMCDGGVILSLVKRVSRSGDALLMKVVRNISMHEGKCKDLFAGSCVTEIVRLAKATTSVSVDLLVEILGTLGNLVSPNISWAKLAEDHSLLPFLARFLQPGVADDDVVLESVIVLGTLANEPKCTNLLLQNDLIQLLTSLVVRKQDDDEIVLQCVFIFYRLLANQETCQYLMKKTQVPTFLIDLLYDKNTEIQKLAEQSLDIIAEYDTDLGRSIRKKKFQKYNEQWCKMVDAEGSGAVVGAGGRYASNYGDDEGVIYKHSNGAAHNYESEEDDDGF